jgi:UDPglucose 6-dehydrogenase
MVRPTVLESFCSTLFICLYLNAGNFETYTPPFPLVVATKYISMVPNVAVIGTGYVGLVTGAGLAEFGNTVVCADIDAAKIDYLKKGMIPIYEPGLKELVLRNMEQERLVFTADVVNAIYNADIIFIAVGTPMRDDGSADLYALEGVIHAIGKTIDHYTIIVTKSTVPVGTGALVRTILEDTYAIDPLLFDVVSNPEFLREGSAVQDFLEPDRLVIGTESVTASHALCFIYRSILSAGVPCVLTNVPTAEIIKYASNAFLATKLSFINEIANLCDVTNSNAQTVAYAMGLDHRISPYFLRPGPGYGGSCFPKDTQALMHIAGLHNVSMNTVRGAMETNYHQQQIPVKKLMHLMNGKIEGKTIAILGLAFKANTDDIRYSPAITAIRQLQEHGAIINAYDPEAMRTMAQLFPEVHYCTSAYDALTGAHAALIMTDWEEFKHLNIKRIASLMRGKVVVDARNILDLTQLQRLGFVCDGIGQGFFPNTQETIK